MKIQSILNTIPIEDMKDGQIAWVRSSFVANSILTDELEGAIVQRSGKDLILLGKSSKSTIFNLFSKCVGCVQWTRMVSILPKGAILVI